MVNSAEQARRPVDVVPTQVYNPASSGFTFWKTSCKESPSSWRQDRNWKTFLVNLVGQFSRQYFSDQPFTLWSTLNSILKLVGTVHPAAIETKVKVAQKWENKKYLPGLFFSKLIFFSQSYAKTKSPFCIWDTWFSLPCSPPWIALRVGRAVHLAAIWTEVPPLTWGDRSLLCRRILFCHLKTKWRILGNTKWRILYLDLFELFSTRWCELEKPKCYKSHFKIALRN